MVWTLAATAPTPGVATVPVATPMLLCAIAAPLHTEGLLDPDALGDPRPQTAEEPSALTGWTCTVHTHGDTTVRRWTQDRPTQHDGASGSGRQGGSVPHILTLDEHPGFYLVRGILDHGEQLQMARDVLCELCDPPAVTNHNRELGPLPGGLFRAALSGLFMLPAENSVAAQGANGEQAEGRRNGDGHAGGTGTSGERAEGRGNSNAVNGGASFDGDAVGPGVQGAEKTGTGDAGYTRWKWGAAGSEGVGGLQARDILDRLRWSSLGAPFDWTGRKYLHEAPARGLPLGMKSLARTAYAMCSAVGASVGWERGLEGEFEGDAALVNYYRMGDTLMAHQDDAEEDARQPIVAVSLGVPGVFVKGGLSRRDAAVALLVRSGDAVVLDGPARLAFHGVPRVVHEWGAPELLGEVEGGAGEDVVDERVGSAWWDARDVGAAVAQYMQGCRINISVRKVAPVHTAM